LPPARSSQAAAAIAALRLRPLELALALLPLLTLLGLAFALPEKPAAIPARSASIGTTYYVSTSGNDAAAGTSSTHPWRTLAKVSSVTFQPGDAILLRSGDVWNEALALHGSGTAAHPITLRAYGNGPRPQIRSATGGAITLYNLSHWVVRGLEAVAASAAPIDPVDNVDRNAALLVLFDGPATYSDITIEDNDLHGLSYETQTYGLHILAYYFGRQRTALVAQHLIVTSNTIHDVGWAGGEINGGVADGPGGGNMSQANGNDGFADVKVSDNTIYDTGVQGFVMEATRDGTIDANIIHDTGLHQGAPVSWSPSALWTLGSVDVTIAANEVWHAFDAQSGFDACGIDVDWDSAWVTVENNQSHDNLGCGVEILSSIGTVVRGNAIRHNQGKTDVHGQISLIDFGPGALHGISGALITGNTIRADAPGTWVLTTQATANFGWSGNSFTGNTATTLAGASGGTFAIGPGTQIAVAGP
jgi:parallel beta-helix repeat protein